MVVVVGGAEVREKEGERERGGRRNRDGKGEKEGWKENECVVCGGGGVMGRLVVL